MGKFFLYLVVLVVPLIQINLTSAELGFRSNSKVSQPISPSDVTIFKSSTSEHQPTLKNSINSSSKGVQLHFRDYSLGEILKNIHAETGIRFNIPPKMEKTLVSLDVEARHWKGSVRKLIADYSRVEVWTNKPKTSQIWLLESNPHN